MFNPQKLAHVKSLMHTHAAPLRTWSLGNQLVWGGAPDLEGVKCKKDVPILLGIQNAPFLLS
eukprot:1141491-Pelagomonas_calceolata.AAC.2